MRLIDADELSNRLMNRWETADQNKEKLVRHLMVEVVTPIVVGTPTVQAIPLDVALDIVHKTIYTFFDVADDDSEEPISAKDELLLKVNKSIGAKLKEGDTE